MTAGNQYSPLRFAVLFISLFLAFYYFNILFFSLTSHGNHYNAFLDEHLNYIYALRWLLLHCSALILNCFGYTTLLNNFELLVMGHGIIQLAYSCLGLGVISFFTAFVLAYPKPVKAKIMFLLAGIVTIEVLNIIRFVLLALFWHKKDHVIIDHHTVFNIVIYIIISISLYFWVKSDRAVTN
ncbi:MAG: hypothetical protein JWQ79_2115 [Mucilaginibacter sp.]|nr:hypothetical protein [Mucilaginibacter sp.]